MVFEKGSTLLPENEIGRIIIDSAVNLHKEMGPGLLESVYEILLAYELEHAGLAVQRQVPIGINYKGIKFKEAFRADLIIENKIIVELKSVETLHNAHKKQVLTYIKLANKKLGFLLNFGESLMKNGIFRIVNGLREF